MEIEPPESPNQNQARPPLLVAVPRRSEAVKLDWESHGTSYSATGGSGHRYEIVVVHHATEWGVKGAPPGWCLKADNEAGYFRTSLGQCKKAASLLEERASLF